MATSERRASTPARRRPGTLDASSVAVALLALSVVTVMVGALVGLAAEGWHGFAWETAAVAGTAVATALLAGFTAALAFTTSSDVRATWELADLTRRDQEERERPIVLEHSTTFQGGYQDGYVTVRLANVGLGPALHVLLAVRYEDRVETWQHTQPSIGPGDTIDVVVQTPFPEPLNINSDGFSLRGSYHDRRNQISYAIVDPNGEETWP